MAAFRFRMINFQPFSFEELHMTMTANPSTNGGVRRNTLSGQIDRLDGILDGLDQALQGAITDAVKEAVSIAVAEAVRSTVLEIVSNPHVLTLLRSAIPVTTQLDAARPVQAE